ncbi:MAG: Xylose isomerase-like TIM barrel [Lentisphaerae bacterium ADurb.Bin242]|nr:MAG: Xylose isomerase-like TIM barrel [Lentisphaerae bacterium ADurb.Bin242]
MKIGVIVESFREPLFKAMESAAAVGVKGIQMYAVCKDHNLITMPPSERERLKKHIASLGLEVASICGDLGGHGFQDAAGNAERVKLSRQIIDLCCFFGTKVMTTHVGVVPTRDSSPVFKTMVKAAKEVGEYAASKGCTLAIETGPEPIARLVELIKAAGEKGLGINFDPANLAMVLNVNPAKEVPVAGKYIVHTHAKDGVHLRDFNPSDVYGTLDTYDLTPPEKQGKKEEGPVFREVPLGTGQVVWDEYLAALRKVGYDGFLTIEREVGEDPKADIILAVEFLKSKIS